MGAVLIRLQTVGIVTMTNSVVSLFRKISLTMSMRSFNNSSFCVCIINKRKRFTVGDVCCNVKEMKA
jgi:hypothetical protein